MALFRKRKGGGRVVFASIAPKSGPNPQPIEMPILIPKFIIVYAVLANVCYTGGWIAELLLSRLNHDSNTNAFGVRVFRMGVTFSVFVTLFPAVLSWAPFFCSVLQLEGEQDQGANEQASSRQVESIKTKSSIGHRSLNFRHAA